MIGSARHARRSGDAQADLQSSRMRILIANDDGYLAPGLAALVQGLRRPGRPRCGRARAERQRHVELADPEPAAEGAHRGQRLSLHQRHAVRLRACRAHRPAAAPARPGGLGHQQRRQHGRRHALLRHRRRGDGGYLFGIPAIAFSQIEKGWGAPRRRGARGARGWSSRCSRSRRTAARPGCSTSTSRTAPMRRRCRAAVTRLGGATRASR